MTFFAGILRGLFVHCTVTFDGIFLGELTGVLRIILDCFTVTCCRFPGRHFVGTGGYLVPLGIDCIVGFIHVTHDNPFNIGNRKRKPVISHDH